MPRAARGGPFRTSSGPAPDTVAAGHGGAVGIRQGERSKQAMQNHPLTARLGQSRMHNNLAAGPGGGGSFDADYMIKSVELIDCSAGFYQQAEFRVAELVRIGC
jgi:hypothetical protein